VLVLKKLELIVLATLKCLFMWLFTHDRKWKEMVLSLGEVGQNIGDLESYWVWYWRVRYWHFLPSCNSGISSSLRRNCLCEGCIEAFEVNMHFVHDIIIVFHFLGQDLKGGGRNCGDEIKRYIVGDLELSPCF